MRPTKLSKPRKRRKFTPEFKAETVRIALTPGKTITEVARELDLTVTCLHEWVRQAGVDAKGDPQGDPQGALTTDERAELTRLRRELRTVEQERDFLKKTAAYFARSQS